MARQAKYLSEMVNSDPQMQIPPYPRLSEDYLKLWYNSDMLIVEGGLSEVVLRGRSVRSLLPQLLPLLDGCRTIAEITACVRGFKDKAIHDALTLLYMQGLLEDGRAGRDKMSTSQLTAYGSALKFYSRYIDFTRASKGRYDLLHALQSKHVLLSATGSATLPFVSALAELGIGEITVIANDVLANTLTALSFPCTTIHVLNRSDDDVGPEKIADHLAAAERPYDLLLLLTDRPSPLWLRALNQAAIAFELPLLRCLIGPASVELGPTVFARQSGCYECARLLGLLDEPEAEAASAAVEAQSELSSEETLGVHQAALLVLALLTKFLPIKSGDTLLRLNPESMTFDSHAVYLLPGCPVCSGAVDYGTDRLLPVGPQHTENWAVLFHANTNDRAHNLFPKGHQMHYAASSMQAVEGAYKSYNASDHYALPTLETVPERFHLPYPTIIEQAERHGSQPTYATLEHISLWLNGAGGRQIMTTQSGWEVGLRLTPSAGGMASQTLYLLSFDVEGIPAGVYHFNPNGHLEALRQGDFRAALDRAVVGAEALATERVYAAVIGTAAYGRVETKYLNKAYRYTHLDAGVMLHSLTTLSQMLGFDSWQSLNFYDDEINSLIDLFTTTEYVAFVLYLTQAEPPVNPTLQEF